MAVCELCNKKISSFDDQLYEIKTCPDCTHRCRKIDLFLKINSIEEYLDAELEFLDESENKAVAQYFLDKRKEKALKRFLTDEQIEERARETEERARKTREDIIQTNIKNAGRDGYYEYTTLSLIDEDGFISADKITKKLNELGIQGWRLACAYTNEIGHNSTSAAFFGLVPGTNATVDQNILILERFVKV